MAKLPPHIQRRDNRFYAVLNIPAPLRKHYPGKSKGKFLYKLVQSLETNSLTVAQRRVGPVITGWKSEFAKHREELDDAVYYSRRLHRAKDHREKSRIQTEIDMVASNIASPSYGDDIDTDEKRRAVERTAVDQADAFYERATGKIVGITDHLDDWLDHIDIAEKTKDMSRGVLNRFASTFPTVQDVTHEAVQRWVDGLAVSPTTAQRMLSALRGYWKYLQRPTVKAVPKDFQPFTDLDLPRKKTNGKSSRMPFTVSQMGDLIEASAEDSDLHWLIVLAAFTGCRIEELCSLKTKHVHLSENVPYIEIEDAKTAAGWRQVPVHNVLVPLFQAMLRESSNGYILSNLTPNKYRDRSNAIGKRFGRLKKSLGYGPEYVFHSIRKTVSTQLENAGVSENVAADILGHEKPRITYGLYSGGSSLEVKAEAINRINYMPQQKIASAAS